MRPFCNLTQSPFPQHVCGLLAAVVAYFLGTVSTLAFSTVVVDAGHGGEDRGGIRSQKTGEKEMTLDVALRLEKLLRGKGIQVVMTRRSDVFVSLEDRATIANQYSDSLFVSIHFDAYRDSSARGITIYYTSGRGRNLAQEIHNELLPVIKPFRSRGLKRQRFSVLRHTHAPAVLLELGYLTNPIEAKRIRDADYRQKLAEAICAGIVRYQKKTAP